MGGHWRFTLLGVCHGVESLRSALKSLGLQRSEVETVFHSEGMLLCCAIFSFINIHIRLGTTHGKDLSFLSATPISQPDMKFCLPPGLPAKWPGPRNCRVVGKRQSPPRFAHFRPSDRFSRPSTWFWKPGHAVIVSSTFPTSGRNSRRVRLLGILELSSTVTRILGTSVPWNPCIEPQSSSKRRTLDGIPLKRPKAHS